MSLKGSTAWDMHGEPFATCLPLACNPCRRANRGSFRGCVVYLDLGWKEYIVLCPKNVAEMDVSHPVASFCSALDASCRILTAEGREACVWSRELEAGFGNP